MNNRPSSKVHAAHRPIQKRPMGKRRGRKKLWIAFASVLLLVLAGLAFLGPRLSPRWRIRRSIGSYEQVNGQDSSSELTGAQAFADSLEVHLPYVLSELGIRTALIKRLPTQKAKAGSVAGSIRNIHVRVPKDLPLAICNLEITRLVKRLGGRVFRAEGDRKDEQVTMQLGTPDQVTSVLYLVADAALVRETGRIALIIDDFGYSSMELVEQFCALRQPLTLSVLPVSEKCERIVVMARQAGHDAMLHMPMEPLDFPEEDPGEGAIFVTDYEEEIRQKIRDALKCVGPYVQGVNNHMGSRATANRHVMETVMDEMRRRSLFFVDSFTSPQSLAFDLARETGVRTARNRVFIDTPPTKEMITDKLFLLAYYAAQNGEATGTGHARRQTLEVLREILPRLEKRGFQFVRISDVVR